MPADTSVAGTERPSPAASPLRYGRRHRRRFPQAPHACSPAEPATRPERDREPLAPWRAAACPDGCSAREGHGRPTRVRPREHRSPLTIPRLARCNEQRRHPDRKDMTGARRRSLSGRRYCPVGARAGFPPPCGGCDPARTASRRPFGGAGRDSRYRGELGALSCGICQRRAGRGRRAARPVGGFQSDGATHNQDPIPGRPCPSSSSAS